MRSSLRRLNQPDLPGPTSQIEIKQTTRKQSLSSSFLCALCDLLFKSFPSSLLVHSPRNRLWLRCAAHRLHFAIAQCPLIQPHVADLAAEVILFSETDLQRLLRRQVVVGRLEWI